MAYSIEVLSEKNAHQWEDFNNRSREGTLFHSIRWKRVLEDAFKLKLRYYLILEDRSVIGIWPFMEQKTGYLRGLVGIPYAENNNIILDDSFNPDHINKILSLFSGEYSFLHFNTYNPVFCERISYDSFHVEDTGNMVLDLNRNPPDAIWNSFSKKMRRDIRIFAAQDYEMQEIHEFREIEQFYRYYRDNAAYINGEALPISFFQRILDSFSPAELRIAVLKKGEIFAGGMLIILSPEQKTAFFEHLALNRSLPNRYTPTYALFWSEINRAWHDGYEIVSFGRQKSEPGNPRFGNKVKFGAVHVPIYSRTVVYSRPAASLFRLKRYLSGIGAQADMPPAAPGKEADL